MTATLPIALCRRHECPYGTPCDAVVVEQVLAIAPIPAVAVCVTDATVVWCNDEARALGVVEGAPLSSLTEVSGSSEESPIPYIASVRDARTPSERVLRVIERAHGADRDLRFVRLVTDEGRQLVGFLTVRSPRGERLAALETAVHNIARELSWIGTDVTDVGRAPASVAGTEKLNERERDVLFLTARGETVAAIAEALLISQSTVRNHLSAIYDKLNVRNRSELLQLFLTRRAPRAGENGEPNHTRENESPT